MDEVLKANIDEIFKTLRANDGKGYVPRDVADTLAKNGLVEVHPDAKDSNGNPAVRLTEKGMSMSDNPANTADTANTAVKKAKAPVEFDTGIAPKPKAEKGERKPGLYDAMEVGQSAHFVGTDAKSLSKKYGYLATQLQRRYSELVVNTDGTPVMETKKNKKRGEYQVPKRKPVREFIVQKVGDDDPKGAGLRLYRTA